MTQHAGRDTLQHRKASTSKPNFPKPKCLWRVWARQDHKCEHCVRQQNPLSKQNLTQKHNVQSNAQMDTRVGPEVPSSQVLCSPSSYPGTLSSSTKSWFHLSLLKTHHSGSTPIVQRGKPRLVAHHVHFPVSCGEYVF